MWRSIIICYTIKIDREIDPTSLLKDKHEIKFVIRIPFVELIAVD